MYKKKVAKKDIAGPLQSPSYLIIDIMSESNYTKIGRVALLNKIFKSLSNGTRAFWIVHETSHVKFESFLDYNFFKNN